MKITKCQNPDSNCPNDLDSGGHMIVYKGQPLVLCKVCGPEFQRKALLDKRRSGPAKR